MSFVVAVQFAFHLVPLFLVSSVVAVSVNTYSAYKVYKQIQQEKKMSGANSQVAALKEAHTKIKKHFKPIKTLPLVMVGSSSIALLYFVLFYLSAIF